MKDSKFIELLNLYVDHQISPSDAAMLEAEIQQSAERRRVYRQYCQMQKACSCLAENFRTQAPAGGKIVDFPSQNKRFAAVTYIMGVAAAAACVALVVVNRPLIEDKQAPAVAVQSSADVPVQIESVVRTSPLPAARVALQPAFALQPREGSLANTSLVSSASRPLNWVSEVKLDRISTQELWFEPRATFQPEDLTFRSHRTYDAQTEMMSFRFQK